MTLIDFDVNKYEEADRGWGFRVFWVEKEEESAWYCDNIEGVRGDVASSLFAWTLVRLRIATLSCYAAQAVAVLHELAKDGEYRFHRATYIQSRYVSCCRYFVG